MIDRPAPHHSRRRPASFAALARLPKAPRGRPRGRDVAQPMLESLEGRTLLSSFTVTSNSDIATTPGTLPYVISELNEKGSSSGNNIQFELTSGLTIQVTSALPVIAKPVDINGDNMTGEAGQVELLGPGAGSSDIGLALGSGASSSTVENLTISGFETGILLGSSSDVVTGCTVGTSTSGDTSAANQTGIYVVGTGCTIGGTGSGDANVISGNTTYGIDIEAPSCLVEGNLIGTDPTGTNPVPNGTGVYVDATDATIGGMAPADVNTIAGNSLAGIVITDNGSACLVEGNLIGTNAAGSTAMPNPTGILVAGTDATIGGTASGDANTISGNTSTGIGIEASSCLVEGDLIGTDAAGATVPNGVGVAVESNISSKSGATISAADATIGGTVSGAGNTISGNTDVAISIDAASCLVVGNLIENNADGTSGLANRGGINVDGLGTDATIGGTASGDANVISGNATYGINIEAPSCLVEGNLIGTDAANGTGIYVGAAGATIGGTVSGDANTISGNTTYGIDIEAPSCLVEGNLIGTNAAGTAAVANGTGIFVDAADATIGGTVSADVNTISGNTSGGMSLGTANVISGNHTDGIEIGKPGNEGSGGTVSCLVEGNLIGTNAAGTASIANGTGIQVIAAPPDGESQVTVDATIGGTVSGDANVISGNYSFGIDIAASSCVVEGNRIGTNAAGTAPVANGIGVRVQEAGATIGGTVSGAGNTISGNTALGIEISISASSCVVEGNRIGTNAAGTAPVANGIGVRVQEAGATIGGTVSGAGNTISGNTALGIEISISASSCVVEGNVIEDNSALATSSSSGQSGAGIYVGAPNVTIGGTVSGDANVISGNYGYGIDIAASSCVVEGNRIGTNAAGTSAVANGGGILVDGEDATIGGTVSGDANTIAGNTTYGIAIDAPSCLVAGNLIGTDPTGTNPVPNGGAGIYLGAGAGGDTIGVAGSGNIIAFNGGPGVATAPGVTGGTIRFNSIFENTGPGIDLDYGTQVSPIPGKGNGGEKMPGGANHAPVVASAAGGVITGTLDASPDSTYIIDFYANPASDASTARPQGRIDLGSATVATDAEGYAFFTFSYTPTTFAPFVTATATDASGTTSDFSVPVAYSLTGVGLTFSATTNVSFQGAVASFTSADPLATAADFTAMINWGDGSACTEGTVEAGPDGFVVTGSHTYATAGQDVPVTVTITSALDNNQAVATSLADVASGLTTYGGSLSFVQGTLYSAVVASFTDSNPQAIAGQFTATINWGDGATSTGTVSVAGAGFDITGSHTYDFAGTDSITVTLDDTLTGFQVTIDATATVSPIPITIDTKNFIVTGGEAFSGTLATFIDSEPRTTSGYYTVTIVWGDGTPNTTISDGVATPSGTGTVTGSNPFTVSASHTFASFTGTDVVTITVTDPSGRSVTGTDLVFDPTASTAPASTPSSTATTPSPTATTSSSSATPASPAVTPAPAASTVALTVLPENITLLPNGSVHGIVATFADSGPAEPASAYKATINWGKGRKSAGMVTGNNGRFVVSGRHVFPRFSGAKTKTVTVTVTNEADGQSASVSESVSYVARHARVIRVKSRDQGAAKAHR